MPCTGKAYKPLQRNSTKRGGQQKQKNGGTFRKRKELAVGKKFAADCGMEQTRISSKESHGFIR